MKHLTGFLALFLCAALPLYAAGLDDLRWTTTNGEVAITDCDTEATGELVIPDTIDGNPVTSIWTDGAGRTDLFAGCTSLTSITIPDSVTRIGVLAFSGCTSLTTIEVGAGNVNYTGFNGVLFNKEKTTLYTYPAGNTRSSYTIPDSVTSIEPYAFEGCTSLTSITIPDSVTSIERFTFSGCTSLTSITIPDGVTSIGNGAFYRCDSLTSITIPDSVTSIERDAFLNCTSLTGITIPDGVTSIEDRTFGFCTGLTSITIPAGVTSIGDYAFDLCRSLTSITIPDSVTSIGRSAFVDCSSLTRITFQGSAPDVGVDAFSSVAGGAIATVTAANLSSFGSEGESWNGLILNAFVDPVVADLEAQLAEAIAERDAAIAERDARPTADQLAAVEAERDARPTAEALVAVEAERDAVIADIQLAFDEVNAVAGGVEDDLASIVDPANAPSDTRNAGVIAQPLESFEVNTFASPTNLDSELALYDSAGTLIASNDDAGSVALPEGAGRYLSQLDFSDGLADGVYFLAVGTYNSTFNSDFAVSSTGQGGEYTLTLPTGPVSGTLEPSGFDWYRIEIGTNFAALQLQPLTELYRNLVEANASAISARDAAIEERDARFTEDQIRGLSADYTIGLNDAGNVQMKFNLFESADLATFAPLTLNPDSVSVVDGSICLEFAPEDRAAFFRFSVE